MKSYECIKCSKKFAYDWNFCPKCKGELIVVEYGDEE